jgi:hypothetical protein
MRDDESTEDESCRELARRLFLAFASHQAGVAYSTLERRFRDQTPPGDYWIALAQQVTSDVAAAHDDAEDDAPAERPVGPERVN